MREETTAVCYRLPYASVMFQEPGERGTECVGCIPVFVAPGFVYFGTEQVYTDEERKCSEGALKVKSVKLLTHMSKDGAAR